MTFFGMYSMTLLTKRETCIEEELKFTLTKFSNPICLDLPVSQLISEVELICTKGGKEKPCLQENGNAHLLMEFRILINTVFSILEDTGFV